MYHLNSSDDDNDEPEIKPATAFTYIQDAFVISDSKHQELMEEIKTLPKPEQHINEEDESPNEAFCMLSENVKQHENLSAHSDLLKVLLKHELEISKTPQHFWIGKFSLLGSKILKLHAEFQYIDELCMTFAKWTAFIDVHQQFPLNSQVFNDLLDKMIDVFNDEDLALSSLPMKSILPTTALSFIPECFGFSTPVTNGLKLQRQEIRGRDHLKTSDPEIIENFWTSSKKLNETFLKFVRDIHFEPSAEDPMNKVIILENIFKLVKRIEKISSPHNIENIFVSSIFLKSLKESIDDGVQKHLKRNLNRKALKRSFDYEVVLEELIRLVKFAEKHYDRIVKIYANVFES